MKNKPLLIVSGEPYSIFLELFFKIFKTKLIKKYNRPIILIGSKNLVNMQMKKMNYSIKINLIDASKIGKIKINNKKINLIDVNLNFKKPFGKISNKSSIYIHKCFNLALNQIKEKKSYLLLNGPISKKHFLGKKFSGVTEYLAHKTKKNNKEVMLIYSKLLSVSPITTHIPLKDVRKTISKNLIVKKITSINNFYVKN